MTLALPQPQGRRQLATRRRRRRWRGDDANDFSFGKVKKSKRKGTTKLTVRVPGAGELELAKTKKVKADDESAEDAGKDKLSIKPRGKAKRKLNDKGKAKVEAPGCGSRGPPARGRTSEPL